MSPPDAPAATRKAPLDPGDVGARSGARVALAVFTVISSLFVVSSTWQLGRGVFLDGAAGGRDGSGSVDTHGPCAKALRRLAGSVEHGLAVSVSASNEETAVAAFQGGIASEWRGAPETAALCAKEPHGADAYAVLERLKRTAEGVARRHAGDLSGVRQDVSSLLGP